MSFWNEDFSSFYRHGIFCHVARFHWWFRFCRSILIRLSFPLDDGFCISRCKVRYHQDLQWIECAVFEDWGIIFITSIIFLLFYIKYSLNQKKRCLEFNWLFSLFAIIYLFSLTITAILQIFSFFFKVFIYL